MKTVMNRSNMEYGLSVVIGAVDKKKLGEYAGSVFMHTGLGGHKVELHATDMEIFATVAMECVGIAISGDVVLPAEKFLSAIKSCGAGDVIITSDEFNAIVEGTAAEYHINGLDPTDFPLADTDGIQEIAFGFPAGLLASCINAVKHSACRDLTKPNINGINFTLTEAGTLVIASTDGHRMSLAAIELAGEYIVDKFKQHTFSLPHKAADLLAKITASMTVGRISKKTRLQFQSNSISICINETTREFPEVRRIIPTGSGEVITVDTDALIGAIESTCIMSDDTFRSVNLDINQNNITITAIGTNNTARATIPCMSDSTIKIRINSTYLLQSLKAMNSAETFIKYFGPAAPLMLMPADYKQWNERLDVIMPLGGE